MEPALVHPRRRGWFRPAMILLVLVGVWSLGWLVAAHEAGSAMDGWIEAEAGHGRRWTCPSRRVGGYPFIIALRCTQPTFAGEMAGHPTVGHVEALRVSLGVAHPRTVEVAPRGPLYLRGEDESFDLVVSWKAMQVAISGPVGRPAAAAVEAATLAVTLATPDRDNMNVRVAGLSGAAIPAEAGTSFTFGATGVDLPTVNLVPELAAPLDAAGTGVLTGTALLSAPTVRSLEAWRAAGGRLQVASLEVHVGSFAGMANGALGLDEAHRPTGRLDTSVMGFEPIARRFHIPLAGVQLGGLLTNLLGGGKPPAKAGAVALPLILSDGRLSVGPIDTGVRLDPLY